MNFLEILAGAEPHDSGFRLAIPEDWHQGRTAYGGLSAALALEAARQVGGSSLPPVRSALVSFVGPLFGLVEVQARVLRTGRNATWISADILRDGEVGLTASFVFMGAVQSSLHLNERPLPEGLVPVEQARERTSPMAPVFLREHFETRYAVPRGDAPSAEIALWVRPRVHQGIDPATALLLSADALPPAIFPLLAAPAPISSMTWQANFLSAAPATRDGWWLLRSRGDYAENGCASEVLEGWTLGGEPVMAGMQSIAVFG